MKQQPDLKPTLDGQLVLVTGAAKRIGRNIAIRLSQQGAKVIMHYNHSEAEAEATAKECNAVALIQADLSSVPSIETMFQQVEKQFGHLDALVNNAGRFTQFHPFEVTEADWDFIHDVNLKGVFFCCQKAGMLMRKNNGGRIVNLSSLGGIRPWADHAHYCASKAGVIMLTQALAKAFAPDITVNSVAPGVIRFGEIEERAQALIRATPAQRHGTGEEVADAVSFFLTATNFITGQLIAVDGGLMHR